MQYEKAPYLIKSLKSCQGIKLIDNDPDSCCEWTDEVFVTVIFVDHEVKTATLFTLVSALRRLSASRFISGQRKFTMASNIIVPDGFTLHTENTSHILLESNEAFLNPVQEFNRDTSVACIRVWSEELNRSKEERWRQNQEKRAKKQKEGVSKKRKGASRQ